MKKFLKLTSVALVCILSAFQIAAVFASPIAKCPDQEFLNKIISSGTHTEVVDSQGINWVIEDGMFDSHDNKISIARPLPSFTGWEKAEGIFQQVENADPTNVYPSFLLCYMGNFIVKGYLPISPYQTCTLEGKNLEKNHYISCNEPSCSLTCS